MPPNFKALLCCHYWGWASAFGLWVLRNRSHTIVDFLFVDLDFFPLGNWSPRVLGRIDRTLVVM